MAWNSNINEAPRDNYAQHIIIAAKQSEGEWIVGEAEWHGDDEEYWWASTYGTHWGDSLKVDYGSVYDCPDNYKWQHLPQPPEG